MENLIITGGNLLCGCVRIPAAKNSLLPLIAACVLTRGKTRFFNSPQLSDISNALCILNKLGIRAEFSENTITINGSQPAGYCIDRESMSMMRGSLMFLGPLLAACGKVSAYLPGGCRIGKRPIDIHLDVFRALGAYVMLRGDQIELSAPDRLKGVDITLRFRSVGATENAILAAATAKGTTIIRNPAREPEIRDLIEYLNGCGAEIYYHAGDIITIKGVEALRGHDFKPIGDRIVASTLTAAVAISGGEAEFLGADARTMRSFINAARAMGVSVAADRSGIAVRRRNTRRLHFPDYGITALPYPGFPTDCTPIITAMMCCADGFGTITDTIFEDRFGCCGEFLKLGANVVVCGKSASVSGTEKLRGSNISANDLRGGAALVCLSLAAMGTTCIDGLNYIDRGYFKIEDTLSALGADIKRVSL